jgi:hypothetical protein
MSQRYAEQVTSSSTPSYDNNWAPCELEATTDRTKDHKQLTLICRPRKSNCYSATPTTAAGDTLQTIEVPGNCIVGITVHPKVRAESKSLSRYMWLAVRQSSAPGAARSFERSTLTVSFQDSVGSTTATTASTTTATTASAASAPPPFPGPASDSCSPHPVRLNPFYIVHENDHHGTPPGPGPSLFSVHPDEAHEQDGFGLVYPVRYVYGIPPDQHQVSHQTDVVGFFSVAHETRSYAFARCLFKLDMSRLADFIGISESDEKALQQLKFQPGSEPQYCEKDRTELRVAMYKRRYESELMLLQSAVQDATGHAADSKLIHPQVTMGNLEAWKGISRTSGEYKDVAKCICDMANSWQSDESDTKLDEQLRKANAVLVAGWAYESHIHHWKESEKENNLINHIYPLAVRRYIEREQPWYWHRCAKRVTFDWSQCRNSGELWGCEADSEHFLFRKRELLVPVPFNANATSGSALSKYDQIVGCLMSQFGMQYLQRKYLYFLFGLEDAKFHGNHMGKLYPQLFALDDAKIASALRYWDSTGKDRLPYIEYGSHQVRAEIVHWCMLDIQASKTSDHSESDSGHTTVHARTHPDLKTLQSILKPAIELAEFTYVNDAMILLCMCGRFGDVLDVTHSIVQGTHPNLAWMSYTKFAGNQTNAAAVQIDFHAVRKTRGHLPCALLWYFLTESRKSVARQFIDASPEQFEFGSPVVVVTGRGKGNRQAKTNSLKDTVDQFLNGTEIVHKSNRPGACEVNDYGKLTDGKWKAAFRKFHERYVESEALQTRSRSGIQNSHTQSGAARSTAFQERRPQRSSTHQKNDWRQSEPSHDSTQNKSNADTSRSWRAK